METAEEWRTITEAPDYAVSSMGRVKRIVPDWQGKGAGRILCLVPCSAGGYLKVGLRVNGKGTTRLVHRLVCSAFKGPPPSPKHEAAHCDGNPANNFATNVRWATPIENAADKVAHGRMPDQRGERSHKAMLSDEAVTIIRSTRRYNGVLQDLAARFGVTENTIMGLRTRSSRKWAHIPHQLHPPA